MRFNSLLMALDQNTRIRIIITIYGMKFISEQQAEFFLDNNKTVKLLDYRITDIRVVDNVLECVLDR